MRLLYLLGILLFTGTHAFGETAELKATAGKLTPAEPPKLQDRMEGSKAAAAAAAAGAATGKVNCFRLMNEARLEEDKSKKMFLTLMANQQCEQASALEQSAKQNDSSRKALTMNDIPKQAKFEAGTTNLETSSVKEVQIEMNDNAPSRPVAATEGESSASSNGDGSGAKTVAKPDALTTQGINAQASPPPSPLNPIAREKVGFDESSKNPGATTGLGAVSQLTTNGSAKNETGTAATPITNETAPSRRRAIATDGGVGVGAEGGDKNSTASGDETMDALMAQLMGPEATPEEEGAELSAGQVWNGSDIPRTGAGEKVNIFEYASVRYFKLKNDDKRLGGAQQQPPKPARSLASAKP